MNYLISIFQLERGFAKTAFRKLIECDEYRENEMNDFNAMKKLKGT